MAQFRIRLEYDGLIEEIELREPVWGGPSSSLIGIEGQPSPSPDAKGDFLFDPERDPIVFDTVHTFATAQLTANLVRDALGEPVRWEWSVRESEPLWLLPHRFPPDVTAYCRRNKRVTFSRPKGSTPECRSLEIVAHEVGHALLDGLHPEWAVGVRDTEPRALHEAFGDFCGMLLGLSFKSLIRKALDTSGNLPESNPFSVFGERRQSTGAEFSARILSNRHTIVDAQRKEIQFPGKGIGHDFHFASTIVSGLVYDVLLELFTENKRKGQLAENALFNAGHLMRDLVFVTFRDMKSPHLVLFVQTLASRAEKAGFDSVAKSVRARGRARGLLGG